MTYEKDMNTDLYKFAVIVDNEYGDRLHEYLEQVIEKIIEFSMFEMDAPRDQALINRVKENVVRIVKDEINDNVMSEPEENPLDFVDDEDREPGNGQYPNM